MKSDVVIPGLCTGCGCTDTRACIGGCEWMDEERTLCSRCAWVSIEDIAEALELAGPDAGRLAFGEVLEMSQPARLRLYNALVAEALTGDELAEA